MDFEEWFSTFFRRSDHAYTLIDNPRPKKAAMKVEPKVFFANERTFLVWLNISVTLAAISMAIVAFSEAFGWSQIYGLLMMFVAILFCAYSLWMFIRRAAMLRRKEPGPYDDRIGPIALSSLLAITIVVAFFMRVLDDSY